MSIKINETNVLGFLDQAIGVKGKDYVDKHAIDGQPCIYVDQTESGDLYPSCIVGWVLHFAGVPLEQVSLLDDIGAITETSPQYLSDVLEVETDSATISVLRLAQLAQDGADTWGEAYAKAEGFYDVTDMGDTSMAS